MKSDRLNIWAVAAVLLLIATPLKAVERADFLVNDDNTTTVQNAPRLAVADKNGFVIVWTDRRGSTNDIYLQRFDPQGYAAGYNAKVNDDTNNSYQFEPAIAVDLSGLYSVVWKDYRNDLYPFGPDIYFQAYDSSVLPVGSNVNLTVNVPDSLKETPDLALGEWGGGVVVWVDYRNRNWDVYGQMFESDGSLVGTDFKINDDIGTAQQHAPRVSVSPQGWFVVTWYDNRSSNDDIFVQRFDSDGNRLGINVKVNSDSQGARQAFPDVAADGTGRFTVAWVDWRNGAYPSNPDIYVRTFDTLMTPVKSDVRVNYDGTQNAQREAAITSDRMGNTVVVWSDSTTDGWNITGQILDNSSNLVGSNFRVNDYLSGNQLDPDVGMDGEYRYVTWADDRSGNWDIYASITRYKQPSLTITPTSISLVMNETDAVPSARTVVVNHTGAEPVDYTISTTVDWLSALPDSGATPDTVSVTVATDTLVQGTYFGTLVFSDVAGQDSSLVVSVRLDVIGLQKDTIRIDPAIVEEGGVGSTPITAVIVNDLVHISLPLQFDKDSLMVDSILAGPTLPADVGLQSTIDTAGGLVLIEWTPTATISPGSYYLGDLYFTAGAASGACSIDTVSNDTLQFRVTVGAAELIPDFSGAEITISPLTDLSGDPLDELPGSFSLKQNYPNPFNSSTLIRYDLPALSKVTLKVYNILGQPVRTLVDRVQPSGSYRLSWDGLSDDGDPVGSGIYFYRLAADRMVAVRKMALLK
ncbi:MAG: FlgD immunoglobulin-like domain containing protein [Candidatus Zixiibacteriota bacterium]